MTSSEDTYFLTAVALAVGWIGVCGIMSLSGIIFVDKTLGIIIGAGLMLISAFGFAGYFVGKDVKKSRCEKVRLTEDKK